MIAHRRTFINVVLNDNLDVVIKLKIEPANQRIRPVEPVFEQGDLVGGTGLEPVTSCTSSKRSPS